MLRTCCTLAAEVSDMLPEIETCKIDLQDLTYAELREWLYWFGAERVGRLRHFSLNGWAKCRGNDFEEFHSLDGLTLEKHMEVVNHFKCDLRLKGESVASNWSCAKDLDTNE